MTSDLAASLTAMTAVLENASDHLAKWECLMNVYATVSFVFVHCLVFLQTIAQGSSPLDETIAAIREVKGRYETDAVSGGMVSVDLAGCRGVTADLLSRLQALKQLQVLRLNGSDVTDDALPQIANLSALAELHLVATGITDVGASHLRSLTDLEALYLSNTGICDEGVSKLKGLSKLTILHLFGTKITNQALETVGRLDRLEELVVGKNRFAKRGCAELIDDEGMAALTRLRNLREIQLSGTSVTDAGLLHLSKLQSLRMVHLDGTRITDNGIAALAKLPELSHLLLFETRVTDAGISQLLPLNNLRYVSVGEQQISQEMRNKLKAKGIQVSVRKHRHHVLADTCEE